MSNRVLLREWEALPTSAAMVKESREANNGRLVLSGVIQRSDTPNQNKRIYPRQLLHREMQNFTKAVKEARALGELDHPETSTVSLEKVSHVIKEVWWEDNKVMGRLEVLPTPMGKIAEALIESGVSVGISSRGVGSTSKNESGYDLVQDDFTLVCFDLVAEPSTPGAFMMREAVERTLGLSKADRIFRALNALREGK